MSREMAEKLYLAAKSGNEEEVRQILRNHPEVNLEYRDGHTWTALQCASCNGYARVVEVLLGQPGIDVNLKNLDGGQTPFWLACTWERLTAFVSSSPARSCAPTSQTSGGTLP